MSRGRLLLAALLLAALVVLSASDPGRYFSLSNLKTQQATLQTYVAAQPLRASAICFLIYTVATALSVPGAMVMTLAAGAVFGLLWATLIVSFASTLGATIAFLMARYLFHDFVQGHFGHRLEAINRGIRADGPTYLLSLRLIPVVPFVLINLLMALTPIRAGTFYLYSQIGMLPATLVYVNAGTQLARLQRLGDIVSPPLLISFALLALFPFVAKAIAAWLKRRRLRERFPPPAQVDRNVIVIGAGSAGLVAALIAAAVRAKVTLIEQDKMGGDCLNTGCVPSKALLRSAKLLHQARRGANLGLRRGELDFDFAEVMQRVQQVIRTIEPHDSVARFEALGVECISGHARVLSPYTVAVGTRELSARAIIIATGAQPWVPAIAGIDRIGYLTSDTVWDLRELPARLLVLGGGPLGCELAQAFARFGSRVTLLEMGARLLPREDQEVSALLEGVFADEGMDVRLDTRAIAFRRDGSAKRACCAGPGGEDVEVEFDELILALGRRASVSGYGLEELGLPLAEQGWLDVNEYLQTSLPSVFACGDAAGPHQFTHWASHQAWYATVNALFGSFKRTAVDQRVVPWCTFTDPEIARVGLSESEARARGLRYEVTRYDLGDLDRAITDGHARGFVKVLTPLRSDRILGALVVGEHAGDVIAEFILAMKHGLGLNKILGTIHIYPTLTEANRLVAGNWRRAHGSPWLMARLERFHRWRREG